MVQALGRLAAHDPDPRRSARVRARCHQALTGAPVSPEAPAPRVHPAGWRAFESALLVGASIAYLIAAAARAVLLHRL
jgi:hypothetical protein